MLTSSPSFRNQAITPEQQLAFAKHFGDIHHHPFMKGMDAYPDILEIIKEEGEKKDEKKDEKGN